MTTAALVLLALLGADPEKTPRFEGGVPSTALNATPTSNPQPSAVACSAETLRASTQCLFDGRALVTADADRARQAKLNRATAQDLGEALCRDRLAAVELEPKVQTSRLAECVARVKRALPACSLEGKEALFDAESHFSSEAQACYVALAEAGQLVTNPSAPPPEAVVPRGTSSDARPAMARPARRK
jgi:hypothetical protein